MRKELSLSQQFAITGLDGLDSRHMTMAKSAVLRGIQAAKVMEELVLAKEHPDLEALEGELILQMDICKKMKKKEMAQLEQEMVLSLKEEDLLEEIPDILGCDMDYQTAGVSMWAYRSDEQEYNRVIEWVRAEVLEEGPLTLEALCVLWLLRECGVIHDVFSVREQEEIQRKLSMLSSQDDLARILLDNSFKNVLENVCLKYLKGKSNLFKNPFLEGVNIVYPFLDRRKAIFIDYVILGTTVENRRLAALSYLCEHGHYVQEIKRGEETLLKVDNTYYRIFPYTKMCKFPIQGLTLVPVYQ